jgi:hypothetical protein
MKSSKRRGMRESHAIDDGVRAVEGFDDVEAFGDLALEFAAA